MQGVGYIINCIITATWYRYKNISELAYILLSCKSKSGVHPTLTAHLKSDLPFQVAHTHLQLGAAACNSLVLERGLMASQEVRTVGHSAMEQNHCKSQPQMSLVSGFSS